MTLDELRMTKVSSERQCGRDAKSMTDRKVRTDLDILADAGPLCQYSVCDVALIHATSWKEHQSISHPTKSKLPPCEKHEPEAWFAFLESTDPALHKFRSFS